MLIVNHLTKKIREKKILNGLNFELEKGQIGIFLGGSGVGKSTLLRVLNHLEAYDAGEFTLDGLKMNLQKANKEHLIGMVFQHFNLFEHLSVAENITLALIKLQKLDKKNALSLAESLLSKYGLLEKINTSVHKLSGGQKQRLAIARTVALNPKIICLDEPTSALDPLLTNQVSTYISDLAKEERYVLLATHDMNLVAKLQGMIFFMEDGKIVENVSTKNYFVNPNQYPLIKNFVNA